jgi:GTP-binding protein
MVGTPVRIEFKAGENPFTENRNKLTARQISRKRRIKTDFSKDKPGKKR